MAGPERSERKRKYNVIVHPEVEKELAGVKRAGRTDVVERILLALEALADDPSFPHPSLDIRKLQGSDPGTYRLRVGDYRVLFEMNRRDSKIDVTLVMPRGRGYRR